MSLIERLEAYLSRIWSTPVTVSDLSRIPGGASRETYRFAALAEGKTRPLILRRDPPGSLIETDRNLEYLAFESFHDCLPVPRPVAMEAEGAELERPFFIMERVEGGAAASPFSFRRAACMVSPWRLMLKKTGPSSASHSGSTAVTHCMYSFEVMTSSW